MHQIMPRLKVNSNFRTIPDISHNLTLICRTLHPNDDWLKTNGINFVSKLDNSPNELQARPKKKVFGQ